MKNTLTIGIGTIALAAIGFMTSGATVNADVKIAATVSASGTGGPNGTSQRTGNFVAYYKGDNLRVENSDGSVMIYSAADSKMYRLNTADKTYSTMPGPPTQNGNPPANNDTFKFESNAITATIAGQSTTQYQLTATGPVGPPPGRNGGPGGAGANGNNDGPPPPQSGQTGGPPTASASGTFSLSDSVKIDSGADAAMMFTVAHLVGLRGPIARPVAEKLLALQEIPLSSTVTIQMPAGPDGNQPTMTSTFTATSVTTDSLDDSLFTIPTGYQQVQAQSHQRGGPGGGGPGGGPGGPGGGGFGGPPPGQ